MTVFDRKAGLARLAQSARAQAELRRAAAVPVAASPEIVAAPARGPVRVAPQVETVMTPSGPRPRKITVDGFHPVTCEDAFDRMAIASANRGRREPAFTVAQVEAGRAYRALAERCACEGVRGTLSSVAPSGHAGGDRSWMDGVIARGRRLAALRAAIPVAVVLCPRDAAALAARTALRPVRVRDVVDGVCLQDLTLTEVLRAFGWPPATRYRERLRVALCAALDGMCGR